MHQPCLLALVSLAVAIGACAFASPAHAGEIAGAPVALPPSMNPDIYVYWGNDAFGRFGRQDDYLTQQSILNARIAERWLLVLDHSIMTTGAERDSTEPVKARLDQLSASLGYVFLERRGSVTGRLSAGLGARATGDFGGAKIQDGFHRLISGGNVDLDYLDSDEVVAIGWGQGNMQQILYESARGWWGRWDLGYWIDGTALASSGGQLDGSGALYGLVENGSLRFWAGLRGDLREGYTQNAVQSATARVEQGGFWVFGLSLGPLVLNTAQAFDADTQSFGNIGITADESAGQPIDNRRPTLGVQVSLLVPDVQVNTQLRYAPVWLNASLPERRRLTLIAGLRYGEPTYDDSTTAYVQTKQAAFQIEIEGETEALGPWVKPYASMGLGVRREMLVDTAGGVKSSSPSVDRGVAIGDAGVRFDSTGAKGSWVLQVKLGVTGWLPFSDADVVVDGTHYTLQEPGAAISAGITAAMSW